MATGATARATSIQATAHRCVGNLTISRAATTEREIDLMPDGMTIDLTEVDRMDTVGAWLVHKLERDHGAKIVGADEDQQTLIDHVARADQP